jgi:hypothetical protein
MVMKNLIKKILKEEEGNKVVKNYVTKMFKKQVDSGLTPHIPYEDLRKKKLTKHIELIDKWYFEFLENHYGVSSGFEKAKTLYEEAVKTVGEKDLKSVGIDTGQDKFLVSIPWIEFYDIDSERRNVVFGFAIIDCYLETDNGMKTYEEMLDNTFPDYMWNDVTDILRQQIEEYVQMRGYDFGLDILVSESAWSD